MSKPPRYFCFIGYGWISVWNGCGQLSYCHSGRGSECRYWVANGSRLKGMKSYVVSFHSVRKVSYISYTVLMMTRSLAVTELSPTNVIHCSACGITYLATAYQRQCSKELFKFQGRWMTHIWCVFSLLESCAFDGERGRRGFVIEVKNNKATACWPTLPVQRPWYESNALCMPLRTSRDTGKHVAFDPAFLLLSFIWPILQNCH